MAILKKTLKKSAKLTEKLLQRLDKEWDDVFKEDEEGKYWDDNTISITIKQNPLTKENKRL